MATASDWIAKASHTQQLPWFGIAKAGHVWQLHWIGIAKAGHVQQLPWIGITKAGCIWQLPRIYLPKLVMYSNCLKLILPKLVMYDNFLGLALSKLVVCSNYLELELPKLDVKVITSRFAQVQLEQNQLQNFIKENDFFICSKNTTRMTLFIKNLDKSHQKEGKNLSLGNSIAFDVVALTRSSTLLSAFILFSIAASTLLLSSEAFNFISAMFVSWSAQLLLPPAFNEGHDILLRSMNEHP